MKNTVTFLCVVIVALSLLILFLTTENRKEYKAGLVEGSVREDQRTGRIFLNCVGSSTPTIAHAQEESISITFFPCQNGSSYFLLQGDVYNEQLK